MDLSEWYQLVDGDELMQGDILEGCPVFRPPATLPWPLPEDPPVEEFVVEGQDVVIMSHTCDLVPQQKGDMWLVILCPLWKLSEAAKLNQFLNSVYGREECRKGHMTGYHMIAQCDNEQWKREISIVSFREMLSLPLDFVRKIAKSMGHRRRIRPPYREHLAQALARYFMRVGLPVDIPPFKSEKAEAEIMKKLAALDEETRNRLLASFK